tara:strand:+ start:2725 stop:3528 length:804 start_codon:yes stop_codon:yes gene_type:complete
MLKRKNQITTPKWWSDITLKQMSAYNILSCEFREAIKDLTEEDYTLVIKKEAEFNLNVCALFSGLSVEELNELPPAIILEYVGNVRFLNEDREPKTVSKFRFKGLDYTIPDTFSLKTKYGQYIEAMQSEFFSKHSSPDSLMYLAHQLAHSVENGKEWNDLERDELAVEFEDIPADLALDFSFFLSKKSEIYSLAYLDHQARVQERSLPFMQRTLNALVGLKRYMNWRSVEYSIDLIRLLLTVFYIRVHQLFSNIFRIFRPNQTTITK